MQENLKISISKQQVANLPKVTFDGEITLIETDEAAREAVAALEKETLIGFDTETKPSFKKGKPNKVALMQLSTLEHCYLFRLNKIGLGQDLCRLLENSDIIKVGISVHDDFNVMHRSSEVDPQGFIELQNMVKEYSIADISLQKVYAILFDKKISKTQRLTNWEAQTLTRPQQIYAATDAWACLQIYHQLIQGLFIPEESAYIVPDAPEGSADTANGANQAPQTGSANDAQSPVADTTTAKPKNSPKRKASKKKHKDKASNSDPDKDTPKPHKKRRRRSHKAKPSEGTE